MIIYDDIIWYASDKGITGVDSIADQMSPFPRYHHPIQDVGLPQIDPKLRIYGGTMFFSPNSVATLRGSYRNS